MGRSDCLGRWTSDGFVVLSKVEGNRVRSMFEDFYYSSVHFRDTEVVHCLC